MSVRATISDSKSDFHKEFPYVIPPIYRKLADELLVELHLLSHQKNFKNTPVFAIGLEELFTTFTTGYKPSEHITDLFNAICNCNGFNPVEIKSTSVETLSKIKSISKDKLNEFLLAIKADTDGSDYYSRINAIGLYKIVSVLPDNSNLENKELNEKIIDIAKLMSYPTHRVEKDISLFNSNIEKMKQALEIMAQNLSSKK